MSIVVVNTQEVETITNFGIAGAWCLLTSRLGLLFREGIASCGTGSVKIRSVTIEPRPRRSIPIA